MALPVITDCYRVTWNFGPSGATVVQPAHNVTHFLSATGTASGLGTALDTNVTIAMLKPLSNAYRLQSFDVLPLDGTSATVNHSIVAGVNGGASGDLLPQVCGGLTFQTAQRGSRGRGRLYMGPSGEGFWSGGFATTSTDITNWAAAWETFRAAMSTAGYNLCVASYTHLTAENVSHIRGNQYSTTQRRRMERLT